MADIVITEFMDEDAVEGLRADYDVHYAPDLVDRPDDLARLVADARALIVRNRTQVRGDLLSAAERLECVGRLGVGLDNIDIDACAARGLSVFPATGANDLSVAEYVITAALALLRGSWLATDAVIAGEWPRQRLIGRELSAKTMGLIGFGAIARETASRALTLGMSCMATDPFIAENDSIWGPVQPSSLTDLLAEADVVSLHVPLTEETRHLIDADALAAMKPDAVLINASRGGVVDEAALADALRDGRLGGAALDVFETEPLTAQAGAKFKGLGNILLTPHIAGVTDESNVRVSALIATRVRDALGGHS